MAAAGIAVGAAGSPVDRRGPGVVAGGELAGGSVDGGPTVVLGPGRVGGIAGTVGSGGVEVAATSGAGAGPDSAQADPTPIPATVTTTSPVTAIRRAARRRSPRRRISAGISKRTSLVDWMR